MDKTIDTLRKFFTITIALFEFQNTISLAFGYKGTKSDMHLLHIKVKEELDKENPDLKTIDKYLEMMENLARTNKSINQ